MDAGLFAVGMDEVAVALEAAVAAALPSEQREGCLLGVSGVMTVVMLQLVKVRS